MSCPRIALATCRDLPDWEVDDRPLVTALESLKAEVCEIPWDDKETDWNEFDATLVRTTWDYHWQLDAFLAWAGEVPRLHNPASLIEWNTHKRYLRDMEAAGVALAPTVWLPAGSAADIEAILRDLGSDRGFIKPQVGANARHTLRFDTRSLADAQRHVDELIADHDLMVQPYLSSVEREGELSAIFVDGEFTHGVRKVPVPGDYRVQDDWGATDEPYDFSADEIEAARFAANIKGDLLYARVDYLRGDDGTLLLNELEVAEPSLFFRHAPHAADRLAECLIERCRAAGRL